VVIVVKQADKRNEIEAMLALLNGTQLVESGRAVDMEMFQFSGTNDLSYALHIQCPWRIQRSGRLVVGYRDMRDPPAGLPNEGFDPNEGVTRRDELLQAFFAERATRPRLVVEVTATEFGDVRLVLDDRSVLEIFPDSVASDDEYWRLLLRPSGGDHFVSGDHFVMSGEGLEHLPAREAGAVPSRTLAQAAKLLDRSVSTLREQVRRGRLAATKVGRDWLLSDAEIERYRRDSVGKPGRPRKT
jgi:excisionase family DNA binding protein